MLRFWFLDGAWLAVDEGVLRKVRVGERNERKMGAALVDLFLVRLGAGLWLGNIEMGGNEWKGLAVGAMSQGNWYDEVSFRV
jgi:hypothetical protein